MSLRRSEGIIVNGATRTSGRPKRTCMEINIKRYDICKIKNGPDESKMEEKVVDLKSLR